MDEKPSSPQPGADATAPTDAELKVMQEQLNGLISILPFANKDEVASSLSMLSRYVETIRTKADNIQADLNYKYELLVNRQIQTEAMIKKVMDSVQYLYAVLANLTKSDPTAPISKQ